VRASALFIGCALAATVGCPRAVAPAPLALPPPCTAFAPAADPTSLRLAWLVGDDVTEAQLRALREPAAALWARFGVTLADAGRERARLTSPFAPGGKGVAGALAPLFDVVRERASRANDGVDVIVLPRLVDPGSPAAAFFSRLDGLTLSPAHRATLARAPGASAEEARALYDALALERFRPTVLVAVDDLQAPDFRLAHELGHALGLDHEADATNLMASQRRGGCAPALRDDQLRALRPAAARPAATRTGRRD
jgi:hypothetical protein